VLCSLQVGCGNTDKTLDPLLSKVDLARDAQAITSLQQALVTAALVRSESEGSYGTGSTDLAQRLQARDGSKRFATTPSGGPDQIQVLGGGPLPMMLVVRSASENYLALWDDGNRTLDYRGIQAPQLVTQRPTGGGWSDQPPH
jgi:hypothetical protein